MSLLTDFSASETYFAVNSRFASDRSNDFRYSEYIGPSSKSGASGRPVEGGVRLNKSKAENTSEDNMQNKHIHLNTRSRAGGLENFL
jgi:hypothetical protein